MDRIVGLEGVRAERAMVETPDGHGGLELVDEIEPLPSSDVNVIPDGEVVNPNEWR